MGGKNRQRDITTTSAATNQATIPGFLRPFVQQSAGAGESAIGSLANLLTPGTSLVSGFTPDQLAAFDLARSSATDPAGAFQTAEDALGATARGDFLFGGPGFNEAVQASIRAAQPSILSTFGAAGRGTGGLAQAAIAQSATDAFSRLFNQERSRQLQAASSLPGLATGRADVLSGIGGQQQAQAERELQGPIQAQQLLLGSALGGLPVSSLLGRSQTGTQTRPVFENRLNQGLGLGLTGLSLLGGFGGFGNLFGGLGGGGLGGGSPFRTDAAGRLLGGV